MNDELKLNDGGRIPVIGFGTWQLDPKDAYESVKAALDTGYRLIDTAMIYRNEADVGRAIKDSGVSREDIFLTTKLFRNDMGYDSALAAIDESLKKLSQDYVDLYLIHWPGDSLEKRSDSWRALLEIKRQGKARHIGVSNFEIKHLKRLFDETETKPSVNQIEFHPFMYEQQKDLLDFCKEKGIVFEAYSPLARGQRQNPKLAEIGQKHGKSASQVMIRWAIQRGSVPLPRSSNPDHVKENFDVFDFKLTDKEMSDIDSVGQTGRTSWDPTEMP